MDHIGVVGLSYRHASVEDVARFAIPKGELPTRLPELRAALAGAELVYPVHLQSGRGHLRDAPMTAPRSICAAPYSARCAGRDPNWARRPKPLRAWTGEAAVEHVLLLACGLDSAQAGEQEINAQLRAAWEHGARGAGLRADAQSPDERGYVDGEPRASPERRPPGRRRWRILRSSGCLRIAGERRDPVGLVGVSPMTRRCGLRLHEAGLPLLIVNRSADAAEEWAHVAGRALDVTGGVSAGRRRTLLQSCLRPAAAAAILDEAALNA